MINPKPFSESAGMWALFAVLWLAWPGMANAGNSIESSEWAPTQAVIYDGTVDAAYLVALKDGFMVDGKTVLPPGVWPAKSLLIDPHLQPGKVAPPACFSLPPLASYRNDCEVHEHLVEALANRGALLARARCAALDVTDCHDSVQILADDIQALVAQAPTRDCSFSFFSPDGFPLGATEVVDVDEASARFCIACAEGFDRAISRLDELDSYSANCARVSLELTELRDRIETALATAGFLCNPDQYAGAAAWLLGRIARDNAARQVASIESALAGCTSERIALSCAGCPADNSLSINLEPEGVEVTLGRQPLGRLVGALSKAGFSDVAKRLSKVPNASVRRYSFVTTSTTSATFVAIRGANGGADADLPEVILLDALKAGAPLAPLNDFGRDLLDEAFSAFRALLAPVPGGGDKPPGV